MRTRHQRAREAAAIGLSIALLTGCGAPGGQQDTDNADAEPVRGGSLRIADEGEAINLNPFIAQDNLSQRVLHQIMEPLFRTDADGELVPWLVERSEPSRDLTRWTMELRDDVTFSDGTPMTADDVVYSIDAIRESPAWAMLYEEIDTVEASSPSTVEITTSVPSPALEANLSLPFAAIVPEDLAGATPDEFAQEPVGTGPFKLESRQSGQRLTLVRNDSYWDPDRPYLDEVVFEAVPSDSSRTQQLRGGELDLIATPPRPQREALDRSPDTRLGVFDMAFPSYLLLNQESEVFADPRVREAAELALDREAIIDNAASGVGEAGTSFVAPFMDYFNDSLEPVSQDPEAAEALLADAVADGVDPTFTLKVSAGDSYENLASQIIAQNLDDVGFTVEIEQLDGSAGLSQVAAGDYDASLFGMTSDILDPSEVIAFYVALNALWTGGETKQVGKLLEAAKQEADEDARAELYGEIQRIVFEDRSLIVLNYQPWTWAMREDVVGFDLPPTGVPWLADVGFRTQ